jgi:energy-coupling factor transporter ATP-binding protein EcfA2
VTFKLTDEQQYAVDLAGKGERTKVIAPAGSGKSKTAEEMARAMIRAGKRNILYLVYNTEARRDAERRFKGLDQVKVRTTSQIGYRAFAGTHKDRMNFKTAPKVPSWQLAEWLKLKPLNFGDGLVLDGPQQALYATRAIDQFCSSNRRSITADDVPLEMHGVDDSALKSVKTAIATLAQSIWFDAKRAGSRFPFDMTMAFKHVALDGKDEGYDAVLLDEAQDSNDNTMAYLNNQENAQICVLGDPAQTLYAWRGSTDQILQFDGVPAPLTQSFRFGEAIAEEAMKHLPFTETGVVVKGLPSIRDKVFYGGMEKPDVVLTRTNVGSMSYALSLMEAGYRVALVKGADPIRSLAFAAIELRKGKRPTRNIELSAFEDWSELVSFTEEPSGGHLKALVNLVNIHGTKPLIDACGNIVPYSARNPQHDVAVTTCHSIKGLEWDNVLIGDDFDEPKPHVDPKTEEVTPGEIKRFDAMVNYVAVSRARKALDAEGLAWINKYLESATT